MARSILILLFCCWALNLIGAVHVFVISQDAPCFQVDRSVWEYVFREYKENIRTLKKYSSEEVSSILVSYERLTRYDTLILVIDSHASQDGTIVLRDPGENFTAAAILSNFIRSDQLQEHISRIDSKGVRILIIVNTCAAMEVLPRSFARQLRYTTTVYSTNSYTIGSSLGTYLPYFFRDQPKFRY